MHKMITIHSFSEIDFCWDQKTLVLVDVDSTLIVPKNPILHPRAFSSYKHVVRDLFETISREQKHLLNHSIVAQPAMIVENLSVGWIQNMQNNQIPIVAITAAKKGWFDQSRTDFHHIRFAQLKEQGIDFSIHCYPDQEFKSLSPTYGDYPAMINGIIYSCGLDNSKGDVLHELLKVYSDFERIVLIDDKMKHLESISAMLSEQFSKIEFLGFHYQGADLLTTQSLVLEEIFKEYLCSLILKAKQVVCV